jgi:hypothetical protein
MSTSDDRAQRTEDGFVMLRRMVVEAKNMRSEGKTNLEIAQAMGISENYVRNLVHDGDEYDWGYNCLISGIHHGRPESIWNIPLLYAATTVFQRDVLKELVVSRIYNDAMVYVERSPFVQKETDATTSFTKEWAERVKELAEERFLNTLKVKIGEIKRYYDSPDWMSEQKHSARLVTENKLNPGYEPLHSHDSINMLCRIIAVSASIQASREQSLG